MGPGPSHELPEVGVYGRLTSFELDLERTRRGQERVPRGEAEEAATGRRRAGAAPRARAVALVGQREVSTMGPIGGGMIEREGKGGPHRKGARRSWHRRVGLGEGDEMRSWVGVGERLGAVCAEKRAMIQIDRPLTSRRAHPHLPAYQPKVNLGRTGALAEVLSDHHPRPPQLVMLDRPGCAFNSNAPGPSPRSSRAVFASAPLPEARPVPGATIPSRSMFSTIHLSEICPKSVRGSDGPWKLL